MSSQVALLKTESVELSGTVTGRQIENIEVNGRNPLDLAKLVPGVVSTANFSLAGIGGLNNLNVNGNRGSQNQLTINGIGAVDTGNNGQQTAVLSMDSVQEFKILTGTYQAEYGRSVGAQISLVTKTGTEQFHGSGYWYHRNESLNANTFLNNLRGLPKPLFRYNDPGYTIGGPIYIPKVFERARHKAYFFWSEEFQRQLSPNAVRNALVPVSAGFDVRLRRRPARAIKRPGRSASDSRTPARSARPSAPPAWFSRPPIARSSIPRAACIRFATRSRAAGR